MQENEEKNNYNKKNYYKGILTGVVLTSLLGGTLLLSGCFVKNSFPSNNVQQTSSAEGDALSDHYGEIAGKLDTLEHIVDQYFLSDEEVTTDDMMEGIYKGYINSLNEKYTVYYTDEEYAQLRESTSGKYSGIGVVVSQDVKTGIITVVRPFVGSPGEKAGILKDDVLYKIAGKEVTGVDLNTAVTWIKGAEGTFVTMEVYRPSEDKYMTFEIERRTIEVPMTEYRMLDNHIGYVSIFEFEETTAEQFNAAIDDLNSQGMQGLVIDLRDNPGGLVDSASAVLDRILPDDKLLVYTIDKQEVKDEIFTEDEDTIDIPIVVLINENSASASEIVSGCLQDYERAVLVGTTSFGKGIVQYVLPLKDGSAVKLTSAKYYTPNGRNIHGIGIEPDVEVELDTTTELDEQLEKAEEILLEQLQ